MKTKFTGCILNLMIFTLAIAAGIFIIRGHIRSTQDESEHMNLCYSEALTNVQVVEQLAGADPTAKEFCKLARKIPSLEWESNEVREKLQDLIKDVSDDKEWLGYARMVISDLGVATLIDRDEFHRW